MKYLSLTLPDGSVVNPPSSVPKGGLSFLEGVLKNALTIMVIIGIVVCLVVIVWSGLQWASSGGDKNKITQARSRLVWAIIGLLVIMISFFIVSVVGAIFGVKLF